MTFIEQINFMVKDLQGRGINKAKSSPFLYRILWKFNIEVCPPIFSLNKKQRNLLVLLEGLRFLIFIHVLLFVFYLINGYSNYEFSTFVFSIVISLIVGILYMLLTAKLTKRYNLQSWKEYCKKNMMI